MPPSLYIPHDDYPRLCRLAAAEPVARRGYGGASLRVELARAIVVPRPLLPRGTVVVGATVQYRDLSSGEVETYVIAWPEAADPNRGRLSVLAPIGVALLGYREGDELTWPTPGGERRLRILAVTAPAPGAAAAPTGVEAGTAPDIPVPALR